ncbi:tryptophan-rich sensory protein [Stakelama sp. CBK3Z-3]|uniref:Tryptophan-rich sensory protein n=1 Tax=Stakelama flava TaxID=2860338 RepID=A0ABS6XI34_9SPHN|nr:tryptophan-rich sensory protein [Stakelama flava]
MSELASRGQLRLAFFRWAIVTVPAILLLGFASSRLVPSGSMNPWYAALTKPAFTPPDWVFPAAWTVIYILMGLSLAIVINARGSRMRGRAITFFALQLIANLAWSPIFFGMHRTVWAIVLIVVMFVLTAMTALLFARVRGMAALLLVPYLLWIIFAAYLAVRIHQLNPDADGSLVRGGGATQITL